MSENHSSQSQQGTTQDPGLDAWAELARRGMERWTAAWTQLVEIEGRVHAQAAQVLEEAGRLQAESVTYALELGRESRRLAVEAARRAAELWMPA